MDENVVTHGAYRKKGYAADCLNFAKKIAEENHCYKMMLLTGSKEESTLNFYRNAGYNSSDKTAFIQWIDMWNIYTLIIGAESECLSYDRKVKKYDVNLFIKEW